MKMKTESMNITTNMSESTATTQNNGSSSTRSKSSPNGFIGVHIGVGEYDQSIKSYIEKLIERAMLKAVKCLQAGHDALKASAAAVMVLENDPLCNAGTGSNLTRARTVECEAAIMCGRTYNFGACGAVKNVKNPIELARLICESQSGSSQNQLVSPSLVTGAGASLFAQEMGIRLIQNKELVTNSAVKYYTRQKNVLKSTYDKRDDESDKSSEDRIVASQTCDSSTADDLVYRLEHGVRPLKRKSFDSKSINDQKRARINAEFTNGSLGTPSTSFTATNDSSIDNVNILITIDDESLDANQIPVIRLDTVGAVCMDTDRNVAAACSSGGIPLKREGRIGQTSIIGAGVYAMDNTAVCTTGCGEYLTKTLLAKTITDHYTKFSDERDENCDGISLGDVLRSQFIDNRILRHANSSHKVAGALVLQVNENDIFFECGHTSLEFYVGYVSLSNLENPEFQVIRMNTIDEPTSLKRRFPFNE